ncbi:MAG: class C beta-lactamase-related serine hydrolase [Desulfobacteraceae bacterium]|nr:MAG: class C beta-lactamase-related serine hydrolase [Desulfobacteraceae bacterium]
MIFKSVSKLSAVRVVFILVFLITLCSCSGLWYVGFLNKIQPHKIENPKFRVPHWQKRDHPSANQIYKQAEKFEGLNSFLIIKDGILIAEWYASGFDKETPGNIKSASKSIISALVGLALQKGYFKSLNQPLFEVLPEFFPPDDHIKKTITLKHLLTMSAGFQHIENVHNYVYLSSDWTKGILQLPMMHKPGDRFNYGTIQTHLLSAALTKASGMDTLTFAQKHLLDNLHISINRWDKAPEGVFFGGSEMYLTPRDMALFGQLYLNNGRFKGNQLVPAAWVESSLNVSFEDAWAGAAYGYGWWLKKYFGYDTYYAQGYGGQRIMNIPDLNMVFVTTADYPPLFHDHRKREQKIEDLIEFALQVTSSLKTGESVSHLEQ